MHIAGLDEVGRGPMFGPVVAAAVILPKRCRLQGLTDSKQLTEKQRNEFDGAIRAEAVAWAIAAVDAETIDRINIRRASLLAMRMAVELSLIHISSPAVASSPWASPPICFSYLLPSRPPRGPVSYTHLDVYKRQIL